MKRVYECEFCGFVDADADVIERHEPVCVNNPIHKACGSCGYHVGGFYPCSYNSRFFDSANHVNEYKAAKYGNCTQWIAKKCTERSNSLDEIELNPDTIDRGLLPPYAKIGSTEMCRMGNEYWRPAGSWGVNFQIIDGKLMTKCSDMPHLDKLPIIPITKEEFDKCNQGY